MCWIELDSDDVMTDQDVDFLIFGKSDVGFFFGKFQSIFSDFGFPID